MRAQQHLTAFLLFALLVLGCGKKPGPDADPTPSGQPQAGSSGIEGTYLVVGIEMWGKKTPDEAFAKASELERTVKISKDRIQLELLKLKRSSVTYKLDPSKSPKEIDLIDDRPGAKSKGNYGIYKVEGDILTLFVWGAEEPHLRPREFKTLDPDKVGKGDKDPDQLVGGFLMLTLKKVSDDTTFISEPPPKPKSPVVDEDGPIIAELTKKGFVVEKMTSPKFPGVSVSVPPDLPPDAIKGLNGQPRIRMIAFKMRLSTQEGHPVTDEVVQGLNKLDGLTSLTFDSCPKITSAAFRDLGRFPMLTSVEVSSSPVDDAATEELAKVKALERVFLDGTKFTDKALANLAKIKTLKFILMRDAKVTASGINMLNALSDLDFLALQGMPAADGALGDLNLPKLKTLNLTDSNITDEGLGKLPVLPMLEVIDLSGLKVTDAGLKHLLKQPRLRSVSLYKTKATKGGAEELMKLKPKMIVNVVD